MYLFTGVHTYFVNSKAIMVFVSLRIQIFASTVIFVLAHSFTKGKLLHESQRTCQHFTLPIISAYGGNVFQTTHMLSPVANRNRPVSATACSSKIKR